eukprot:m.164414 g.164414  ORF g.164414 m.164414 type:complete len:87 (+) comp18111_c0_seq81:2676-2936(+)
MCDVELLSSPRLQASQAAEKQRMQDDGDEIDEMRENEFYLSRLDAVLACGITFAHVHVPFSARHNARDYIEATQLNTEVSLNWQRS